ncbi:MAG TPA: hypothetical protein VFG10_07110 [Saprospiraceae bacterium]|nr:hypothetical protein [Saprospiraceae bacterium]
MELFQRLEQEKDYRVDTKTHFAGAGLHMQLITFIRFLSDTYFTTFGMYDESQYWQTNNKSICENEFTVMEQWVRQMIKKMDKIDGRIREIGNAGEMVDERIFNLLLFMPSSEIIEQLYTPRPIVDELIRVWN